MLQPAVVPSSGLLGSSSYLFVNANQASTTTALNVSTTRPAIGAPVAYTATVTPSFTDPYKPSGSVAFGDGSSLNASCAARPVSAGTATCTVAYSAAGSHLPMGSRPRASAAR